MASNIRDLIGLHPYSDDLHKYIATLAAVVSTPDATIPEVKSYPDAVYLNFYALGLSLLFVPLPGYTPTTGTKLSQLNDNKLVLNSIDLYNIPPHNTKQSSPRPSEIAFSTYPRLPVELAIIPEIKDANNNPLTRPSILEIKRETTGKDVVRCLGEPDRKGGGAGPISGSIGIWCEWSQDGIMVEFGGDEARGLQAWERGKDAVWKVITLFSVRPQNK
jgi:serine/threonine protein kinase